MEFDRGQNSGTNNYNNGSRGYLGAVAAAGAISAGGLYYLYSSKRKDGAQENQERQTEAERTSTPASNQAQTQKCQVY